MPWLDAILARLYGSDPAFAYATQFCINKVRQHRDLPTRNDGASAENSFLSMLLHSKKSSDSEDLLVSRLFGNVIAGADTTASTLISAIYLVIKHRKVVTALRSELDGATLDDPPTFDQIHHLPYLAAVVSEALRLQPAVGLALERVVPVGGLLLPDGPSYPKAQPLE